MIVSHQTKKVKVVMINNFKYNQTSMKVIFTNHTKLRLIERNISVSFIKQAIKNPDFEKLTFGGKTQIRKKFEDKVLEIICAKYPNKIIIITLYYL